MCVLHKASIATVQRAMEYLRNEGFVHTMKGEGSYVAAYPPHLSHFGLVLPFDSSPSGQVQYIVAWRNEAERYFGENARPGGRMRQASFFHEIAGPDVAAYHRDLIAAIEGQKLAGLIFPNNPYMFQGTPIMQAPRLPRVAVSAEPIDGVRVLMFDGETYWQKVFGFLSNRGRRRVAFVVISLNRIEVITPYLISTAKRYGMTTEEDWVQAVDLAGPNWAENAVRLLLKRGGNDRPDALVIADDNLVPAATAGIVAAGARVPEDLDVVAHCNFPWPTQSAVPAMRAGFSIRKTLETAVDIIERRRRGDDVPDVSIIPAHSEYEPKDVHS